MQYKEAFSSRPCPALSVSFAFGAVFGFEAGFQKAEEGRWGGEESYFFGAFGGDLTLFDNHAYSHNVSFSPPLA